MSDEIKVDRYEIIEYSNMNLNTLQNLRKLMFEIIPILKNLPTLISKYHNLINIYKEMIKKFISICK